jgi:hypothetical protein
MQPGDVFALLIVVLIPTLLLMYVARRYFSYREKHLDAQTNLAAEKAAQYAASNAELAARVRVLEEIVTDGGIHTAAQIEALRQPRLSQAQKAPAEDASS